MVATATPRASYAEYLALDAASELRHEFVAGTIVAMAGGSIEHGRIIGQVQYLLRVALAGKPCAVLASDVRVRIRAADRATYPDVLVVCGAIQNDADDAHAIVNPTVIIEVLSDSTAAVDREDKSFDYRRLPSLSEYVLIAQRERSIEVFRRNGPRRWTVDELLAGERLALTSLGVELAVDEIYRDGLGPIIPSITPPASSL
ncbi:MAG TPA: Uma2 family endonuclease [Kofleriaceae bacterium]|jgi:Uma2 family endonuclease|nr:Uma2 family endonuclease [Kofleriaceae bacterium]